MSIVRDQEGEGKRRRKWWWRMRKCLSVLLQETGWLCVGSGQSGMQKEIADELERRERRRSKVRMNTETVHNRLTQQ